MSKGKEEEKVKEKSSSLNTELLNNYNEKENKEKTLDNISELDFQE